MYTYEQRMKAVQLLIEYHFHIADVISELGYPTPPALRKWYRQYSANGDLRKSKSELNFDCEKKRALVRYTQEEKEQTVIDFFSRDSTIREVKDGFPMSVSTIYCWKTQMLGKGRMADMKKTVITDGCIKELEKYETEIELLKESISRLHKENEQLIKENCKLQLQKDVLEAASEILKKDKGVNLELLNNREKAMVINTLCDRYPLCELLSLLSMAKSSYFYQKKALNTDKYSSLRQLVRQVFSEGKSQYGYRRVYLVLKSEGIIVSEKVIRRIMKEEQLTKHVKTAKKYNSYKGEISPEVDNIIHRDFHADKPNCKWLTDITEFHIPAGKVYLSPIIDCFDGMIVSWTIGKSPNAELVNEMLDNAISILKDGEKPIVHSDRGCHYRWPGWIDRMTAAGLTRSMSAKGCSPDNAACEGFFGRLKNEMFYGHTWQGITIETFIEILNDYLKWYNEKRIKVTLKGMSPINYRRSLGLVD